MIYKDLQASCLALFASCTNIRSAVMTSDPILESEDSSFEVEDHTFALPLGKHFCMDEFKQQNPMLGIASAHDPVESFVDPDHLLDMNDLGSLSARYF
jgi:hypothetical protein